MGTTYKGIYIPVADEDNWDVAVNANWTRIADRDELVRKSALESVTSSTTLQDDNHLVYTMTANHTWAFHMVVLASSSVGTAMKANFTVPASASWSYVAAGNWSGVTAIIRDSVTSSSDAITGTLISAAQPLIFDGIVTCGATAGNFQFQWAQNASSGTANNVAVNSYLLMKLLV